jgi:hypothetical protein
MDTPEEARDLLDAWVAKNPVRTGRVDAMYEQVQKMEALGDGQPPRLAVLSVTVRTLREAVTS